MTVNILGSVVWQSFVLCLRERGFAFWHSHSSLFSSINGSSRLCLFFLSKKRDGMRGWVRTAEKKFVLQMSSSWEPKVNWGLLSPSACPLIIWASPWLFLPSCYLSMTLACLGVQCFPYIRFSQIITYQKWIFLPLALPVCPRHACSRHGVWVKHVPRSSHVRACCSWSFRNRSIYF